MMEIADMGQTGPVPAAAVRRAGDTLQAIREMLDDEQLGWALWPRGRPGARAAGFMSSAIPA